MTPQSIVRAATSPEPATARRVRSLYVIMTVMSALSWVIGFMLNEDTSGGAKYDFETFHWPAPKLFADQPFLEVLRRYPSATTPLQHILMSSLPWVHDPLAY